MLNPRRVVSQASLTCPDYVYGDYWEGPTRLSLVDRADRAPINTIEIHQDLDEPDVQKDSFRIPFSVPSGYYDVPHPSANKGAPRILLMRDLTGEGLTGQFVLFEHIACGIVNTSVFGYNPTADKAVQYQIETLEGKHKPTLSTWVPQIFATPPTRSGYWRFTWEAGHGDWFWNHEEVSFDRGRQLFVRSLNQEPYPGFGEASCDLDTKKLASLLKSLKPLVEGGFTDSQIQDLERLAETRPPSGTLLATPINATYKGKDSTWRF
jgi:hypothetical protein